MVGFGLQVVLIVGGILIPLLNHGTAAEDRS